MFRNTDPNQPSKQNPAILSKVIYWFACQKIDIFQFINQLEIPPVSVCGQKRYIKIANERPVLLTMSLRRQMVLPQYAFKTMLKLCQKIMPLDVLIIT